MTLSFTSCQAPIADGFCREVIGWLAEQVGRSATFISDITWEEREAQFDRGEIDVAWICGAPYVRKVAQPGANLELLAAPVAAAPRYQNSPLYFSDVVVHRDSPYHTLADLRGTRWAYNEPHSHSGYKVVQYALAERGERDGYFGRVVQSGAHQTSLAMILAGQVDASAIDSTVLEMVCALDATIAPQIRIIDAFGPSPMPPWCIGRHVPEAVRQQLRQQLLELHEHADGQTILARHQMARFAAATDELYDVTRRMLRVGSGVPLEMM